MRLFGQAGAVIRIQGAMLSVRDSEIVDNQSMLGAIYLFGASGTVARTKSMNNDASGVRSLAEEVFMGLVPTTTWHSNTSVSTGQRRWSFHGGTLRR